MKWQPIDKNKIIKKIASNVVAIRKEKGISQSELARLTDKDRQNIHKFEKAQTNPSVEYLIEVANALEINLAELFK
jgi:transcriptional regulator with XRE-family HTH domain